MSGYRGCHLVKSACLCVRGLCASLCAVSVFGNTKGWKTLKVTVSSKPQRAARKLHTFYQPEASHSQEVQRPLEAWRTTRVGAQVKIPESQIDPNWDVLKVKN